MSQVHKDCVLWTQVVNASEAMEKHSWPNGVTSWNDTVKFAQLVFGRDVPMENYWHRLPHASDKSFLLFARGACGSNTPLSQVADWIQPHFAEIAQKEREIGNHNNPLKSQRMQARGSVVTHYFSAQLTRAPCTCRTGFGADANHKHVPTASDMWINGRNFARLWDATLLSNFACFQNRDVRPVWLHKSWQALWNWNDHMQGHGIDPHVDYAETYSSLDPIVSLSFGRGGVLTLGPKKGGRPTKMLFQEDGDALVMAGAFQSEFVHGVPKRASWRNLQLQSMYNSLMDWEKCGVAREIEMHEAAAPGASHVRLNCTIRWHDTHFEGCPAIRGSKPAVAGEDQLPDPWAVDEPLYPVVGAASSGQFAGIKLSECAGAEQFQADTNFAASSSGQFTGINLSERAGAEQVQADTNVAAASSGEFAGIKLSERAGAEHVQAVDHRCENLHDKEVQVGQSLSDIVQTLLACLDQCVQQSELFKLVLHSVPWAVQAAIHEGTLRSLAASVEQLRKQLLAASEAVAELGNDWNHAVQYNCLNLMGLAVAQRQAMHMEFDRLCTHEGPCLVETVPNKPYQNCLRDHMSYRKCLLSHYQLELLLLEGLSASEMKKHGEIAFDLTQLQDGNLLAQLECAARSPTQGKQCYNTYMGMDEYGITAGSVVLMKALELGYVCESEKCRRVQIQQRCFKELFATLDETEILKCLQKGFSIALEHLRTLDVGKKLCDRASDNLHSQDYNIWVWLWKVG